MQRVLKIPLVAIALISVAALLIMSNARAIFTSEREADIMPAENSLPTDSLSTIFRSFKSYVIKTHPEVKPYIVDANCCNILNKSALPGYTKVTLKCDGWIVEIGHAITPMAPYEMVARYQTEGVNIRWEGIVGNQGIEEKSYKFRRDC